VYTNKISQGNSLHRLTFLVKFCNRLDR